MWHIVYGIEYMVFGIEDVAWHINIIQSIYESLNL